MYDKPSTPFSSWQRWRGIMKCYPFEEKRLAKWTPPWIVQPKYDGVRCRAVHTANGYILLSSEENLLFSVPHIIEALNKSGLTIELDGELYCHGMSFEDIVSITSRTQNLHPNHQVMQYHLFDIVTDQLQSYRTMDLEKIKQMNISHVVVAPFWLAHTLSDVMRVFDLMCEQKFEGIIVRHCDAKYERKRSTWVMKFKPKQQDIYEIVGTQEEIDKEGLEKGSLGALVCKSGDGNVFNVGTGFSAEQRQILWEVRDTLVGRSAVVKYQHITTGMKVPRFPVFVEVK